MSSFSNFIKDILNSKSQITNASSGDDFEERIKAYLKKNGFSEMAVGIDKKYDNYIQKIKGIIQNKTDSSLIENELYKKEDNEMYKRCFRWQPYGSQDFPDFLVFTENKVFSIEVKYSTKNQTRPMWNSNLPKMDAIYIFGVYGRKDLTVFRGEDILPDEERKQLISVWDNMDNAYSEWEEAFKRKIDDKSFSNKYGFSPYVRKAYQQTRNFNENAILDFFSNNVRTQNEKQVLDFIEEKDKQTTISVLENITP